MKKLFKITLFLLIISILSAFASEQTNNYTKEFLDTITMNEPQPYSGKSLQEQAPFSVIPLSPESFTKSIKQSKSEESVWTYLQNIGLPISFDDASFVYNYKNHASYNEFLLPQDNSYICAASVSFVYSEEANDNYTFLFAQDNSNNWYLVDSISSFGEIYAITDLSGNNTWLIGHNGIQNQTVRWYHLQSNSIVLTYLEQGVWADSVDYHISVESYIDIPTILEASQNTPVTICRQVSIVDFTDVVISTTANEKLVYTQISQYVQTDAGTFELIHSAKYY